MYVEVKDRSDDQEAEKTRNKLKLASTDQQHLVSRLLHEQEVPKDRAAAVVQASSCQVDTRFRSQPMATSLELARMLEDSVD